VDSADPASLAKALEGADLVVHSAGPFQGGGDACAVLEAGPLSFPDCLLIVYRCTVPEGSMPASVLETGPTALAA
jgi:hypothetical protein